jgi:predicted TIM-barrel fold metal-dependent hydrolase
MAFADIPLGHGNAAIAEMLRATEDLGLHGVFLESNYDGKPLDAPEFRPFFEEANRKGAVIKIHPVSPLGGGELLKDYYMRISVGFPYEMTLTIGRLVCSGVLEKFQNITFILSHAGGAIPFLWWRMDFAYSENWPDSREIIRMRPTEYLRRCYYDTALTDSESLMLVYRRVGKNLIFGTDRPYRKNAVRQTIKTIEQMDVTEEDYASIYGGNALSLSFRNQSQ